MFGVKEEDMSFSIQGRRNQVISIELAEGQVALLSNVPDMMESGSIFGNSSGKEILLAEG